MIASMTGFGQASASVDDICYWLEIKSLNGKFFKAAIKLPEAFNMSEPRIEQILRERLVRGSITCALRIRDLSERAAWDVNGGAVKGYIRALEESAKAAGAEGTVRIDLAGILALPGVCHLPEPDAAEQEKHWQVIERLTAEAVDQLMAMRDREGRSLHADLDLHCTRIAEALDGIKERAGDVITEYAEKLRRRVQTLLTTAEVQLDEQDLAREIAIFAERADINEELARLASHLEQFRAVMTQEDNVGRKLEFLAQEMLRETNTIGSKANDSAIARHVVEIKGHIDRIKEQAMNAV